MCYNLHWQVGGTAHKCKVTHVANLTHAVKHSQFRYMVVLGTHAAN